jgi:hypothetical protein
MGVLSLLNKMLRFYSEGYILDIICYLSPGTPVFPPLKLTPRYNWTIVEPGVKHHNPKPNPHLVSKKLLKFILWRMDYEYMLVTN